MKTNGQSYGLTPLMNFEEFESLSGHALMCYIVRMKDYQIDDNFLNYFVQRKDQWDIAHLEAAVWWLGKSGLLAAYHEIVKLLDHHSLGVRILAIGLTVEMNCEIDAQIMSGVLKNLESKDIDAVHRLWLKSVLTKPASKDAQVLAQCYLEKQ